MKLGAKAKYAQVKQYETERQAKLELLGEAAIDWAEGTNDPTRGERDLCEAARAYALAAKRSR
jgi:hypothetical protein